MPSESEITQGKSQFAQQAEQKHTGLIREFWDFLKQNKKWWLMPIIIVLLILGVMVIIGASAGAPFIYALF